jgi:two-component system chemotaxis response regulator CheB
MRVKRRIKVLIVDDSLFFREILAKGISSDTNIEVVAKAMDPFDARNKILTYHPDVMICDVEMPKMNGIEFIRRLLPHYILPIIVVSSVSGAVYEAMDAGAVDFVSKPNIQSPHNLDDFMRDLIAKIKIASISKVKLPRVVPKKPSGVVKKVNRIIAFGASTGGTEALFSILQSLPPTMPGMLITQHIPSGFSRMFAERMNNLTQLNVKEAEQGDFLEQGKVLVAPGGRHMMLKRIGGCYTVSIQEGEKVNGHCPSVDVLFESVAKEAGSNAIGVILTGMGHDGAKGLLSIRQKEGRTIGQDEESSVVYGMPKAAQNLGAVEKQSPLNRIPQLLLSML